MNRTAGQVLLCCASLVLAYPVLLAASNQIRSGQTPNSALVFLYATVQNKKGDFAVGLDKSYFTLKSQKESLDIAYLSAETPAASIALLYDLSGSMKQAKEPWHRAVRDGIAKFLKQGNQANEYMLMSFGGKSGGSTEWSRDGAWVIEALNNAAILKQHGDTALYDVCKIAVEQLSRRANEKRVIILITDGQDNSSRTEYFKLREILKQSAALVYSVAPIVEFDSFAPFGQSVLREFSKISGGESLVAKFPSEVTAAFEDIASRLQHHYRIGFRPTTLDNKWHPISLSVTFPTENTGKSVRLLVHTRQGYYATAPR